MERDNDSDGSFLSSLAFVGGAMIGMGIFSDDLPMRIMGGVFLTPTVIKYSAMAGQAFCDYVCGSERSRKFEKIGRNFKGKYLGGGLESLGD